MSKGFGYFVYILFSCACGLLILYYIIDSGMLKLYLPWMGFTFILGVCLCIIGALMNEGKYRNFVYGLATVSVIACGVLLLITFVRGMIYDYRTMILIVILGLTSTILQSVLSNE